MTHDAKAEGERVLRLGLAHEAGRAVGPIALWMLPALGVAFLYGGVNFVVVAANTGREPPRPPPTDIQ